MSKIIWDGVGDRLFEFGVDHGVLYTGATYNNAEAWNGLINVTEQPEGGEPQPIWADNIKFANLQGTESLKLSVEAFMYPRSFAECDGSAELISGVQIGQQVRKTFGMCYRTTVGSDESQALGRKLHLVYGCLAAPSEKAHATVNDNPEAQTMSWSVSTTPVPVTGAKPTASITIDSTVVSAAAWNALEAVLFGSDSDTGTPRLPLPDEVKTIIQTADAD